MVGKYLLTLLIFIVHCKTYVSIELGIASAFKWHSQRIAVSCLFPSPESLACTLEKMMVLRRQIALLRNN